LRIEGGFDCIVLSHQQSVPIVSFFPPGIPAEEQRVLFRSEQLEDGVKLYEAGVGDEDTLYILLRLLGGAKKRKKKTYTKPKKQKHKHKKVKLAVLKYYKASC
jgi:ubiquitin-small subunit ribosomal protein S27Ae